MHWRYFWDFQGFENCKTLIISLKCNFLLEKLGTWMPVWHIPITKKLLQTTHTHTEVLSTSWWVRAALAAQVKPTQYSKGWLAAMADREEGEYEKAKKHHRVVKRPLTPLRWLQGQQSLFIEKPSVWWYIDSGCNERLCGGAAASLVSLLCLKGWRELCPVHADNTHWDVVLSQLSERHWEHTWCHVARVYCVGVCTCKKLHSIL